MFQNALFERKEQFSSDMKNRNIKIKILDVDKFYNEAKELDQKGLKVSILAINPSIIVVSICFSETLDLRFALEVEGIFPELRLKQDLTMVTHGKQIELDETQRELLYTVSEPENLEKLILVKGPEGSGKTILSMEVLKIKLSHYIRKFKLNARVGKFIIKVFVCGWYNGKDKVIVLLKQLMEETKDISDFCDLQLKALPDFKITNVGDFVLKISELVPQDDHSIEQTIIFMDELFPAFHSSEWQGLKIEGLDFVLSIRHAFHDGMFQSSSNPPITNIDQSIVVKENLISCQLSKPYRCTKQLIDFMYYWLIHSSQENEFYKQKSFVHSEGAFDGPLPLWIEVPIVEVFIDYANSDEQLKDAKDVLVLFDIDYEATSIHTLRRHCLNKKWRFYTENEAMGSEAQIVIIYDTKKIHFESLSRAVQRLIIVTSTTRRDYASTLGSEQSQVNLVLNQEGLPENWTMQVAPNGRVSFVKRVPFQRFFFISTCFQVFFINHKDKKTTWVDPRNNQSSDLPIPPKMSNRSSAVKTLTGIRDGKHDSEVCKQNCAENGKTFNHPPYVCSYMKNGIPNLIQYKKLEVETLPSQVWSQDDGKAMKVADIDLKSALVKERESDFAMGLRTDDDIKELANQLEKL